MHFAFSPFLFSLLISLLIEGGFQVQIILYNLSNSAKWLKYIIQLLIYLISVTQADTDTAFHYAPVSKQPSC